MISKMVICHMADNHGCVKSGHSVQCLISHTCNTEYYATEIEICIVLYVCKEFVYSKFNNMCCRLNEKQNGYLPYPWQITMAVQKVVTLLNVLSLTHAILSVTQPK